jgi:hypothetical protein
MIPPRHGRYQPTFLVAGGFQYTDYGDGVLYPSGVDALMNVYQTLGTKALLESLDASYGSGVITEGDAEVALSAWKAKFAEKFHGRFEGGGLLVAAYSSESFSRQVSAAGEVE